MKLYMAGGESLDYCTILDLARVKRRLLSFCYIRTELKEKKTKLYDFYGNKDIFIDSGAYSAFKQGTEINIMDYIDFLQFHQPKLYANLDDIKDWQKTLQNQKIMEQAGLKPLPVWHAKEPIQALKDYLGSYDYVGIGFGTLDAYVERENLAKILTSEFAGKNFHIFGLTDLDLIADYDFYSADSTTWLQAARYGELITPYERVSVSYSEDLQKKKMHIDKISGKQRGFLQTYFEALGFSAEEVLVNYGRSWVIRAYCNAVTLKLYEKACNELRKKGSVSSKMLDSFFRSKRKMWQCLRS